MGSATISNPPRLFPQDSLPSPTTTATMVAPLNEIHDFLISLAFQAGDIITNALPDTGDTGSKKNSTSLPTRCRSATRTHRF